MASKAATLIEEFNASPKKISKCAVCFNVPPEVRQFIEETKPQGTPIQVYNFLKKKGLWPAKSYTPIRNHWEHMS